MILILKFKFNFFFFIVIYSKNKKSQRHHRSSIVFLKNIKFPLVSKFNLYIICLYSLVKCKKMYLLYYVDVSNLKYYIFYIFFLFFSCNYSNRISIIFRYIVENKILNFFLLYVIIITFRNICKKIQIIRIE